jgi:uncharacterized protein YigE (DUF2233 family)
MLVHKFDLKKRILFTACMIWLAFPFILTGCQLQDTAPSQINTSPSPMQTEQPSPRPSVSGTPQPSSTTDPNSQYFSTEEKYSISPDQTHWAYSSPSLCIDIQKHQDTKTLLVYYVAHIRTQEGEGLLPGFGNGKPPGSALLPNLIAQEYKAVYAQNGDYFADTRNPTGVVIREGKVYRDNKAADTLAVMPDGTLRVYAAGEINAAGLQTLGVQNTYSFGPGLIHDGIINPDLKNQRLYRDNPRSGIGMVEKGHYVAIVVEGRDNASRGVNLDDYAKLFAAEGCIEAYNFDGGASSCMVFMGQPLNTPTDRLTTKTFRRVPDVIMFGRSDAVK